MNYDWNNEAEFLALNGEYDEMFNVAFNKFVDGEEENGFNLMEDLAIKGHEVSQLYIGCAYLLGHMSISEDEKYYVKKNKKKAIKYLYESAKQGNKDALHNLKEIRKDTPLDDYVTQQRA